MKILTIKKLQETFVHKVCTVLTTTISKTNFGDQQFAEFFTGIIESIDEDGVFTKHLSNGCRNYYAWPHIVGILEEQFIEETDPKYEKIISEVRKAPPESQKNIVPVDPNVSPFVNTEMMQAMASQAKDVQNKMLRNNNVK